MDQTLTQLFQEIIDLTVKVKQLQEALALAQGKKDA